MELTNLSFNPPSTTRSKKHGKICTSPDNDNSPLHDQLQMNDHATPTAASSPTRKVKVDRNQSISTPHRQTPLFIKSYSRIEQILLLCSPVLMVHFAVVILISLKAFFLLWIWTVTTRPLLLVHM
jgi:hypothetical protein